MDFRARDYFDAAAERMRQAREIFDAGERYALAMYCAGLAVECLLRAFRWQEDPSFEGRHALLKLLKDSGLLTLNEQQMRERGIPEEEVHRVAIELRAAVNEVATLWHNNLRFASEARLKSFLASLKRHVHGKGDIRRENARNLLKSAQTVFDRGAVLWKYARK